VRELAGIGEFDTAARDDGPTGVMIDLLGDAYRWVGAWRSDGHDKLPEFKPADLRRRWDETLERALAVHPPRPGRQTPARNLALRLRDRREEFLHFTTDFPGAFSNNCAEQAIRMIKIKTKVSGGFRTLTGGVNKQPAVQPVSRGLTFGVLSSRNIHAERLHRLTNLAPSQAFARLLATDLATMITSITRGLERWPSGRSRSRPRRAARPDPTFRRGRLRAADLPTADGRDAVDGAWHRPHRRAVELQRRALRRCLYRGSEWYVT
jgi:Transposase IS66 family